MPLQGKYLKYSPEITLEIFTLVWNKLIEYKFKQKYDYNLNNEFENFKDNHNYLIIEDDTFNTYLKSCIFDNVEITVQEILGYDPFVKDFVLPEKWYIKCTPESKGSLDKWAGFSWKYTYIYFDGNYKTWSNNFYDEYVEITFGQFKKYVLKETIETQKEVIPEYVECIIDTWSDNNSNLGKIFKVEINSNNGYCIPGYCIKGSYNWSKNLKPSTKEAYNLQQLSKSIKKWSPETYVVCIKEYSIHFKVGDVAQIQDGIYKINEGCVDISKSVKNPCMPFKDWCKWFATKSEAEEFAKTLVEVVKETPTLIEFPKEGYCEKNSDILKYLSKTRTIYNSCKDKEKDDRLKYVCWNETNYWFVYDKSSKQYYSFTKILGLIQMKKQQLKQAVHCKTQEEWDFVISKFNPLGLKSNNFNRHKSNSIIIFTDEKNRAYYGAYSNKNETSFKEILSFQEWCDLNGYKIEPNQEFKVGDYVICIEVNNNTKAHGVGWKLNKVFRIHKFSSELDCLWSDRGDGVYRTYVRHATLEEINNHLISIGQISDYPIRDRSTDDLSNYGLPTEPPSYMYEMKLEHSVSNPKLILSIDDKELPMVNIIKTNSIKQLLNLE